MKSITLLTTSVLVIISVQGCAVNKGITPTGNRHADGTIEENFLPAQHNGAVCIGIGYRAFQECYGYGKPEDKPTVSSKENIALIEMPPAQDKNIQIGQLPPKEIAIATTATVSPQPIHSPVNYPSTPKPSNSCSPEEEKKHATVACAAVMGGCEVAMKLLNKKDDASAKYLGDQGCAKLEAELRGNDYGINEASITLLKSGIDKAADDTLKDKDAPWWKKGAALFGKGYIVVDKINSFNECRADVAAKCSANYRDWLKSAN